MKIELAPVEDWHIEALLADLTKEDRQEILAMGVSPEWGVRNSVETSIECATVLGDGRVGAIVGLIEPQALAAHKAPWLLVTNFGLQHPLVLLRLSRKVLARWRAEHPYLMNYVDTRHCRAVDWLAWLGAELTLEPAFGPFKRPFYKFEFGAPPCA